MMKTRKKLTKISLSLFLAVILALSAAVQSSGRDYDEEIKALEAKADKINAENKKREDKINSLKNDVSQQQAYINEVNTQIAQFMAEIEAYNELINTMNEKISNTENIIAEKEGAIDLTELKIEGRELEINRLDEENKENIKKFGEIIRHSYMSSDSDAFDMLMGSTDFYGLLISAKLIQNTNEKNVEFMNSLLDAIANQEEAINQLEKEKGKLNDDRKELLSQKEELEAQKEALVVKMNQTTAEVNQRYNTLASLTADKKELEGKIASYKQEIKASNAEVEEINKAVEDLIREKQRANNPSYGTGFIWPLDPQYKKITCNFGWDSWRGGMHYGTDVGNAGIGGANIYAAQSGVVIVAYNDGGWHGGYGNYVVIDHGGGISTLYAHGRTGSVRVSVGDTVKQGDHISSVGQTGWATGDHLHYEVRINGKAVDPMQYYR